MGRGGPARPGQPAGDKVVVERKVAWGFSEGGQAVSRYAYMLKVVPLTEDQIKKINELWEAQQAAIKECQAANADKVKALQADLAEASKNKDRDARKKLSKEFADLYAGQRELYQKTHAQIMDVLTPEQKAQLQQSQAIQAAGPRWSGWA